YTAHCEWTLVDKRRIQAAVRSNCFTGVLFLNPEVFDRGVEDHPVDALFRQLDRVKSDSSGGGTPFLEGHVEPVLRFGGIAATLVIPACVSLGRLLAAKVMHSLTDK